MAELFDLETVDRLLSTTRAVRRRLDFERPVERQVLLDCIRLSQQSPTGEDSQGWRWVIVMDPELKRQLAVLYSRDALDGMRETLETLPPGGPRKAYEGAIWLAENLAEVPALVIPCVIGRPPAEFSPVLYATIYGSILPAVWSFQLALRSRGLGSCFTTLHLAREKETRELLGIPEDVLQAALLPVAYTKGTDFRPARRPPPETITFFDRWQS